MWSQVPAPERPLHVWPGHLEHLCPSDSLMCDGGEVGILAGPAFPQDCAAPQSTKACLCCWQG